MIFKVIGAAFVIALNVFCWYTMSGVVNRFIYTRTRRPVAVERVCGEL